MKNEIVVAKKKTIVRDGKVLDVIPFTLAPRLHRLCGIESTLSDKEFTQRHVIIANIRSVMKSKGYQDVTVCMANRTTTGRRKVRG